MADIEIPTAPSAPHSVRNGPTVRWAGSPDGTKLSQGCATNGVLRLSPSNENRQAIIRSGTIRRRPQP